MTYDDPYVPPDPFWCLYGNKDSLGRNKILRYIVFSFIVMGDGYLDA